MREHEEREMPVEVTRTSVSFPNTFNVKSVRKSRFLSFASIRGYPVNNAPPYSRDVPNKGVFLSDTSGPQNFRAPAARDKGGTP